MKYSMASTRKPLKVSVVDTILDKRDKQARKERADKGKERRAYLSTLPAQYKSYLQRANKKGISFELTVEEFAVITRHACTYCGSIGKVGIDRIDSSIGYCVENCTPACGPCNLMKHVMSTEAFLRHVAKIHQHSNRRL